MRIFLTFLDLDRVGGIQRYSRLLISSLEQLQFSGRRPEIRVLTLNDPKRTRRQFDHAIVEGCGGNKLRYVARLLWTLLAFRPSLVIFGHILLTRMAVLARAVRPRSQIMAIVYGFEVWGPPFSQPHPLERFAVHRVLDSIASISQFTVDRMRRAFGVLRSEIYLLPCALSDSSPIDRADTAEWCSSGRPFTLITVSRLASHDRKKNVHEVLEAITRIDLTKNPLRYIVVGEGALRRELEQFAESLNVSEHVRFTGYVSDEELDRLYRSADAYIMPSSKEGFGIVFLEAWRYGLPVIAGTHDAAAELGEDGIDGYVVDHQDSEQIARRILGLMQDPALRRRMGNAGQAKVAERYSCQAYAKRLQVLMTALTGHQITGQGSIENGGPR